MAHHNSPWPVPDSQPDSWFQLAFDYPDFPSSPSPSTSPDSASAASPRPSSPLAGVKQESDDAAPCFIIESLSGPRANSTRRSLALAPPTEVPLRATHASSDMRRMMNVFRLNPFAIHDGEARGTLPANHEAAHPLDAEPLVFEFQLEIFDTLSLEDNQDENVLPILIKEDTLGLRSFSPDFELHHDDPAEEWRAAYQQQQTESVATSQLRAPLSVSTSVTQHHRAQRQPRLHSSASHPYLKSAADSAYASSSSSSHIHHTQHHHQHQLRRVEPHINPWSTQPLRARPPALLRSSPAMDSSSSSSRSTSAYADVAVNSLPIEHSLVPMRRWSLPNATYQHQHSQPQVNASPDPYQQSVTDTHAQVQLLGYAQPQPTYQHHQQSHPHHSDIHAHLHAHMLSPLSFAV
ncbi:hypothetical protein DXG03_003663 [Asterophora parasitica]|uniref:Uncharacterized protein n=1 Tax=Asterophora parasitica TaxID=117018 RepID=A0A9P7GBN3_9AGAR|nr:hypothetical protein DXG03_003663 [Asterophora parasitica]